MGHRDDTQVVIRRGYRRVPRQSLLHATVPVLASTNIVTTRAQTYKQQMYRHVQSNKLGSSHNCINVNITQSRVLRH